MSLSPVSVQKIRDNQFIGDLMNLFERRKIKLGDPDSFENFGSILASNDAFRSQLFTLCTAISHMSAEDLSGEQLLTLVARALGGPALPKRDGVVEIPDSMRSAFLSGYEAWSNRGSEPKEPLPWPTPRQSDPKDESLAAPQSTIAEAAPPRPTGPGMRTVQEALDIARERALADPIAHPATRPGASTEGLTLSELKALLEEMEKRVNRLQPHLHDLTSPASSPADLFARRATMHEIDAAPPAIPEPVLPIDLRASPFSDPTPAQTAHRNSRPSRINEAAFLVRHAYLRPAPKPGPDHASASAVPQLVASPAPTPAAPLFAVSPAAIVAPVPEPVAAPPVPIIPAPAPIPVAAPILVAPAPLLAMPSPIVAAAQPTPPPYIPELEPASLAIGRLRITSRMAAGILAGLAAVLLIVSGLAGLLLYPSLHPKSVNDYPDLKQAAQPSSFAQNSAALANAASSAQIVLAAPDDPGLVPALPQKPRYTAGPASKPRVTPQPPAAAVWPYNNQVTIRDVYAPSSPTAPGSTVRRVAPPAPPLYVPSSTLIAYALSSPQPSYPADQSRGIVGTVVVQIAVSRDGNVTDVRVVSGPVEMRAATVQAVQSWRFRPYLVNGVPADVTTTLGFLFRGQ